MLMATYIVVLVYVLRQGDCSMHGTNHKRTRGCIQKMSTVMKKTAGYNVWQMTALFLMLYVANLRCAVIHKK